MIEECDEFELSHLEILDIKERADWILRFRFTGPEGPGKKRFIIAGETDWSIGKLTPKEFVKSLRKIADLTEERWNKVSVKG